jgi:hypothetical protein
LAEIGSIWCDSEPLPAGWIDSGPARSLVDLASALIAEEYGHAALIVLKDPRLCRLAPVYNVAVNRAGFSPRYVVPMRHPGEVVASLAARDQLDESTGELLWIRQLLEVEEATRPVPRVWTAYSELIGGWQALRERISTAFNITWPHDPISVAPEIQAFLQPELRHFALKTEEAASVGRIALTLWRAAGTACTGDETELRLACDAIRANMNEIDRLGEPARRRERTRRQTEERQRQSQQSERAQDATTLGEARAELGACRERLAQREAELAAAQTRVNALLHSTSWRLTAPLRRLARALGRA